MTLMTGFPGIQMVKNLPAILETGVQSLGQEDSLGKGIATHYNILGQQNCMDRGTWQATFHGVTKSQTQLKQLRMRARTLLAIQLPTSLN